jgi:hypothetical protein
MTVEEPKDFAQDFYFAMKAAVTGRLSRDAKRRNAEALVKKTKPFERSRPKGAGCGNR